MLLLSLLAAARGRGRGNKALGEKERKEKKGKKKKRKKWSLYAVRYIHIVIRESNAATDLCMYVRYV